MGAVCDRCGAKKIVHICDLCGVIEFQRECARLAARNANLLAALKVALPVLRLAHDTGYDEAAAFDAARAAIERNN